MFPKLALGSQVVHLFVVQFCGPSGGYQVYRGVDCLVEAYLYLGEMDNSDFLGLPNDLFGEFCSSDHEALAVKFFGSFFNSMVGLTRFNSEKLSCVFASDQSASSDELENALLM